MSSWFIRRANISAGGSEPTPRLPAEFTELAYLQSDGNQYINTGIVPDSAVDVIVDLQLLEIKTGYVYGTFTSANQYYLYLTPPPGDNTKRNYQFGWCNTYYTTQKNADTNRHVIRLYCDGTNSHIVIDDTDCGSKAKASQTGNTYPFLLFRGAEAATVKAGLQQRVWSCKMKNVNTNVTLLDLVPAKRKADDVVGMYDLVSGSFLTNAGTGTFSYGEL